MPDGIIQLQTPADTAGAKLDSTEITRAGGVVVQRQRLDVVNRYHQKIAQTRTGTGAGQRIDFSEFGPLTQWALQVNTAGGGSPTAWTVNIETSLDGVTFQSILQHTTTDMIGAMKYVTDRPALHFQIFVAALTLGGSSGIVVTAIGT